MLNQYLSKFEFSQFFLQLYFKLTCIATITGTNKFVEKKDFWLVNLYSSSIFPNITGTTRVSVQGVKSLGEHFACLCRVFEFYEVKKNCYYFSKRK